jgi:phospholipid-transporting ATPase
MNWFLIFTNFVPISLLITLEMVKLIQGFFINWDLKLWDEHKDLRTVVNASNLNEELGQINAIFSDKTGTLTQNKMTVMEIVYGGEIHACETPACQY